MSKNSNKFLKDSSLVAKDLQHRQKIKFNMSKYDAAVEKGKGRYKDLDAARNFVGKQKRKALSNLDESLLQFERVFEERGNSVYWASDSVSACGIVEDIIKENKVKLVVKSKSMTTEEIDLNKSLEALGVHSIETDLGEYIVQLAGEKPYHIVTPAMHKSKIDVNKLFNDKFNLDLNLSAEELTNFVRNKLRKNYQEAEVGVTGANFIICDIGAVSVTENEGNALMSTSFPKIHIVIVGIEKVIPSINDIGKVWPVLAQHGTGQALTVYNSIFTGAKKDNEDFGPEKMYVILLDNKRSGILQEKVQADSLSCIRCGACLNACPIYKNIGGYTFNTTYSGPIGSIISPFLNDFDKFSHLSYACSVCGKCTEVCPAKIDIHKLLLYNRSKDVTEFHKKSFFGFVMKIFKNFALSTFFFDSNKMIKNILVKVIGGNMFGKERRFPEFRTSFRKSSKTLLR